MVLQEVEYLNLKQRQKLVEMALMRVVFKLTATTVTDLSATQFTYTRDRNKSL